MSRSAPATPEELTATLDKLLAEPRNTVVPSDTGLDDDTLAAVQAVWNAAPNPSPRLIEYARAELAAQLDGTHEREQLAAEDAMILGS